MRLPPPTQALTPLEVAKKEKKENVLKLLQHKDVSGWDKEL